MTYASPYRPIRDYAAIGDSRTAALVALDGSIDWCCWPRFDAPAVFCRLLDARRGGYLRLAPVGRYDSARSYVDHTNVLTTTFRTGDGAFRLIDFMPVGESRQAVLRLVEGLDGQSTLEVAFHPTFDYARKAAGMTIRGGEAIARAGEDVLRLRSPAELRPDERGHVSGRIHVRAGDRHWITLTDAKDPFTDAEADAALGRTVEHWQTWSGTSTYQGPYRDTVRRSALALKLLTFAPTGALVAAPTTSLPEAVGGVRNWDYRFVWLRDSALVLSALMALGHHGEADAFFDWLERLCVCGRDPLQIVYRLDGSPELPELTLDHLDGYRGSRPVRIGNAAGRQAQLDVYGHVLDAAYVCHDAMQRPFSGDFAAVLRALADRAAELWRTADHGIWEVRGERRHFVYSKVLCWVALDRAIRLSASGAMNGDDGRWAAERDAIRETLLRRGFDRRLGAFTQAIGEPAALDASTLAVPLVGFLPADDPRVRSTVERIRERLTGNGLVYRYLNEDGLPGGEATFALCSFWLVDDLALAGRVDEAAALFERAIGYANDVGLLSEEIDPSDGALLGNHPQAFSHLAVIRSALHIAGAAASRGGGRAQAGPERVPSAPSRPQQVKVP